ncbi:MAG TPA: IgGFc-binding protein [Polyangia bacterium]
MKPPVVFPEVDMKRIGFAFLFAVVVAGCARVSSGNLSPTGSGGAADGGADQQSDRPGVVGAMDGAANGTGGAGGASDCLACSTDQRTVTDCNGIAVKTCSDDQACQKGACVDACAIAEATGSAQGCDFYAVVPPPGASTDGSCFAAMLANTWTAPITVTVAYAGQSLDVAQIARSPNASGGVLTYDALPGGKLAPGQMAILFLNATPKPDTGPFKDDHIDCPIAAGLTTAATVAGTGTTHAFHISTSAPAAAYDIYPYGGAKSYVSSATLLVPTSAWGTNYVAADGYKTDPQSGGLPSVQIVAAQDDTQVTINPTVPILAGTGVAATSRGQAHTYNLAAGQVLQFLQSDELAGSAISANKAIGVWGGQSCMDIPVGTGACDAAHQELVPVNLLGFEYAAVRYRDRVAGVPETVPWTLVGAVDGTTLTYDPAPPIGAPATVNRGQSFEFSTADAFTVKSADQQHPFYLAGHMTGWQAIPIDVSGPGDPETVNTVPPQQWLSSYVFLTDPTYSDTNLVFVRQKIGPSFSDVTLDCAGTLTGWTPIGMAGNYEFTTVDLVTAKKPQGTCDNGVHTAQSDAPFGLTVWGWDFAVSYAYPAGMSVRKINKVVVIP